MTIDWSLGQGNGAQNAFQTGFQIGDMLRRRGEERQVSNALSGLVANPQQDDSQFAELTKGLPGNALLQLTQARQQYQQNAAGQQRAQIEQRRADLPLLGNLLENSVDEASYQANLKEAQRYGIDISDAPPNFNQEWRDQRLAAVKSLSTRQGQEALSTYGKEGIDAGYRGKDLENYVRQRVAADSAKYFPLAPGGGLAAVQPGQGAQLVIAPNSGGVAPGTPVGGAAPSRVPQGAVDYLRKNPSLKADFDAKYGTGAADRILGGGSGNATGGFR